jgi:hypothetical protein
MITSQLLSNGIEFQRNHKTVDLPAVEEEKIEQVYLPLCKDIVDAVLTYGFVTIIVEDGLPYVMPVGTYTLLFETTMTGYTWKVVNPINNEQITNARVFSHFGFTPLPDGTFVSILSKVLDRIIYLNKLRQTSISMEENRTENIVYSEIKEVADYSKKEGVDYDFYADCDAGEMREDMKFVRNTTSVSEYKKQMELYDQYLGKSHATKATNGLDNVIPLPNGHALKAPPMNTGRTDLVAIHKSIEEEICAAIGIPRSMVITDGGGLGHSSDTQGTHETFMYTIMWWKKKIGTVLTALYNEINCSNITKGIDFTKEEDLHETKAKYLYQVYFPVTPYVCNEQLRLLYEQGVIAWETYAKYALLNVSLPMELMQPKAPVNDKYYFTEIPETDEKKRKRVNT